MATESKSGRVAPKTSGSRGRFNRRSLDPEQSARVMLLGGAALIVVIALAFVAFGYWYSVIKPGNRTVLAAEGVKVSYNEMKRRMMYEYSLTPSYRQSPQFLPEATYSAVLNDITLLTRAGDLGVSATPEEIEERLRSRVGVASNATPQMFADRFREVLKASNLTEGEYRRLVHAEVLGGKIRDKFSAEAPASIEQTRIEIITVDDLEVAEAAIERVEGGEAWGDVARDVSTEPEVDTTGGLQDFALAEELNFVYRDFASTAEPGEISEPLSNGLEPPSYHVVRVVERSDQPLTDEQKPTWVNRRYNEWLTETQATMTITRNWDVDDQSEALLSVLRSDPPLQQQPLAPPAPIDPPADGDAPADGEAPEDGDAPTDDGDSSAPDPSGAPQPGDGE